MSTFVSVGNARQHFPRLLDAVKDLVGILPKPIVVQHGHTPFGGTDMTTFGFVGMEEFLEQMQKAQILILHAGVGAVLQAIECGRVPIVMPRRRAFGEHVDDHQVDFASRMEQTGLVVVADTAEQLGTAVHRALNHPVEAVTRRGEPQLVSLVREALHQVAEHI